jgi:hypothetical protein
MISQLVWRSHDGFSTKQRELFRKKPFSGICTNLKLSTWFFRVFQCFRGLNWLSHSRMNGRRALGPVLRPFGARPSLDEGHGKPAISASFKSAKNGASPRLSILAIFRFIAGKTPGPSSSRSISWRARRLRLLTWGEKVNCAFTFAMNLTPIRLNHRRLP